MQSAVEFSDSKICELACQWVKPDGGPGLTEYFQQVFPVAERYGVNAKVRLIPEHSPEGDFLPQVISMVEWPRLESFDAFMLDPDYRALYPLRDAALKRLIVTHARTPAPAAVTFSANKVYEVAARWERPDGGSERMTAYLAESMPIAMQFGAKPVLQLMPIRAAWGGFLPTRVHVVEWPDADAFARCQSDRHVRELGALRESALSKLTVALCRAQVGGH